MKTNVAALNSSVGRKAFMALSGIALMGFVVVHLIGNLALFTNDGGRKFNAYAHGLHSLGPLLYVAEAGLLGLLLLHVALAFGVRADAVKARPRGYALAASKGGNSRLTVASRSMLVTGLILLLFIPLHVWMFKYNAGRGFTFTDVHGREMKDLYLVVLTAFKDPLKAWAYAGVMFLLGFHLRHGFWSSLQSLGTVNPKMSATLYGLGLPFAVLMAAGFVALPLYLLYFGPSPETLREAAEAMARTGGAP